MAGLSVLLTGSVVGLGALGYRLARRYGQALLRIEELEANEAARAATPQSSSLPRNPPAAVAPNPTPAQPNLLDLGMPAGSVGMNFELPSLDGTNRTLTMYKGRRVLLIFISGDCNHSVALLPALTSLPVDPAPDQPLAVLIAGGSPDRLRLFTEEAGIRLPVLLQTSGEVSALYFVRATPSAYLLDEEGITELDRIEGPQAILGVAFATTAGLPAPPRDATTAIEIMPRHAPIVRRGDPLPRLDLPLLDGGRLTNERIEGGWTLLVLFDPLCEPCLDLLPDLASAHRDASLPNVIMITRRDAALTRGLAASRAMPYPIACQEHWDVSRRLGALAVPMACLLGPDGTLAAEPAIGQQAVQGLMQFARTVTGPRRLVSLGSLLGSSNR